MQCKLVSLMIDAETELVSFCGIKTTWNFRLCPVEKIYKPWASPMCVQYSPSTRQLLKQETFAKPFESCESEKKNQEKYIPLQYNAISIALTSKASIFDRA